MTSQYKDVDSADRDVRYPDFILPAKNINVAASEKTIYLNGEAERMVYRTFSPMYNNVEAHQPLHVIFGINNPFDLYRGNWIKGKIIEVKKTSDKSPDKEYITQQDQREYGKVGLSLIN